MRTLTTIVVIVLFLIGGSFTSYRYIQTTTQNVGTYLESVEQSISSRNWDEAKKGSATVRQSWDKNNTWWSILLDHQEIDTIDLTLKRLERFIETEDLVLSLAEVSSLKLLFEQIYDKERFTLKNVL